MTNLPFTEKYRPSTITDIVDHDNIIHTLNNFVKNKNMPHLLLHGPSGIGKCLDPSTKVLLFDGNIKKVSDLTLNDKLIGNDLTKRNIQNINTGYDIMYEINQSIGNNFSVNSEHILTLYKYNRFIFKRKVSNINKISNNKNILSMTWIDDENKLNTVSIPSDNIFSKKFIFDKINSYIPAINYNKPLLIKAKKFYENSLLWKNFFFSCKKLVYFFNTFLKYSYYQLVNFDLSFINSFHDKLFYISSLFKKNRIIKICDYNFLISLIDLAKSIGIKIVYKKKEKFFICKVKNYYNYFGQIFYKFSIKKKNYGKYIGFELDNNKLFLLADMTITHNTSTIYSIINKLYSNYNSMILELNASDDRGIDTVRGKIKRFVNNKSLSFSSNNSTFKLVILDEIDAMTNDAQAILRKIVEQYTFSARFCLICNHIQKIIPALISRCILLKFSPISSHNIEKILIKIAVNESIKFDINGIKTIIHRSNGDLRKAINTLQTVSMSNNYINSSAVNNSIGFPNNSTIYDIIELLINSDFKHCFNYIYKVVKNYGFSTHELLSDIHDFIFDFLVNKFSIHNYDNSSLSNFSEYKLSNLFINFCDLQLNISSSDNIKVNIFGIVSCFYN